MTGGGAVAGAVVGVVDVAGELDGVGAPLAAGVGGDAGVASVGGGAEGGVGGGAEGGAASAATKRQRSTRRL